MSSTTASRAMLPGLQMLGPRARLVLVGVVWLLVWNAYMGTQQVANALTLGAIYALVALGYTMVYGIIELINFAHGDVFMVGAFVTMMVLAGPLGQSSGVANPLLLAVLILITVAAAMISMGIVNLLIERFAYRRLRNAPRLAPLITAIGVSFILQNVIQIWHGTGDRVVPQIFPLSWRIEFLDASIGLLNVFILLLAVGLLIALQAFVGKTRLGRAMRSTAQDREAAALMGVDLNQTIATTFLLAGALAGAAGVIQGLYFGYVRFDLGFNAGLKAFTAAVLGGIGNLAGAVVGGFIIGFIEVGAAASGLQRWSHAIVFVVLIVVLVFRPSGILGQHVGDRA